MAMFAVLTMVGYGLTPGADASLQAGVDFFFFIPYLLWSPIAGWIGDRVPRRWLMFAADEIRGLLILAILLILPWQAGSPVLPAESQWQAWMLLLAIGICAATFSPVKLSIIPNVVGTPALQRANAVVVNMGVIGNLSGAIVGSVLISSSSGSMFHVQWCIGLAAGAYIISGLFWAFLKAPQHRASTKQSLTGIPKEISKGLTYAKTHRPVLVLITLAAIVWAGTSVYLPYLAVIATSVYQGDLGTLGYLQVSMAIGMLSGGLVLGILNARLHAELWMTFAAFFVGFWIILQLVLTPILPYLFMGILFALIIGFHAGILIVALNSLLQRISPDFLRARIFGAKEVITQIGKVAISFAIWQLGNDSNPAMLPLTLLFAGIMMASAVYGLFRFVLTGPSKKKTLNLCWRFVRLYSFAFHKLKVHYKHRVPPKGPVLFICNHTAGIDPILVQSGTSHIIRWMMAAEYRLRILGWFWRALKPIMVDRDGKDTAAVREAIAILKQDDIVGIFPEGGINEDRSKLGDFADGAGLLAKRARAVIQPVFITGTPQNVKPITSLFKPSHAHVYFAHPVTVTSKMSREDIITEVKSRIQMLRNQFGENATSSLA